MLRLLENSLELRQWTLRKLIPELTKSGYRIYCPVQHAEVGRSIDEEVIEKMSVSRNIIVMLSTEYIVHDDGSCEADVRNSIEWRHAWNLFRKNKRLRLILVNFALLCRMVLAKHETSGLQSKRTGSKKGGDHRNKWIVCCWWPIPELKLVANILRSFNGFHQQQDDNVEDFPFTDNMYRHLSDNLRLLSEYFAR